MDCSPPGSSVHGILQARILERVAVPSSRGSFQPRDRTLISCVSHMDSLLVSCQGQPLGGSYFKQTPDVEKSRHIFIQASEFVFRFIVKND